MLLEAGDLADHVDRSLPMKRAWLDCGLYSSHTAFYLSVVKNKQEKGMERRELAENYLQTLNLQTRKLDFDFLSNLVKCHVATFAFSSVGCQLGDDLPLDFESLYRRIVVKKTWRILL